MYDFANILFAGPCNRACPFCIGRQLPDHVNVSNLDLFPLRGLDAFVSEVNRRKIPEIVLTGTTSDPQLYHYEGELLLSLRQSLHSGARLSVHTNGARALKRIEIFNGYDRACLSLPSFVPATYRKMMGPFEVPDVAAILRAAKIPVKISCVVSEDNLCEVDDFVRRCALLGVRRLVFRRLFGDRRRLPILEGRAPARSFRGNPVYQVQGVEVTVWDFFQASSRSINLFADGTLGSEYLLAETAAFREGRTMPVRPLWGTGSEVC